MLVLLVVLALEHSPLLVSRIAEVISKRLSLKAMDLLGINPAEVADKDFYDRTWRAIHSLLDVIDPFPGPRNRLLTNAEQDDIRLARDEQDCARKQVRLDRVAAQLMEATMQMIPWEIRRKWKGNVCIDATPVAAFGKRGTPKEGKSNWVSIEPDAAWYVREDDHRDPGDDKAKGYRKVL